LPMTVIRAAGAAAAKPRKKRAAPPPPASTVIRMPTVSQVRWPALACGVWAVGPVAIR
jgi:hypothetical protein